MPQSCSHCSRVNPNDAVYCYFDGSLLPAQVGGAPPDPSKMPFPTPFVMPNGQRCTTFDQLAMSCQNNWSDAMEMLHQGYIESFLGGLGRIDLAMAAREAVQFPDPDRGLDQLLSKLPSSVLEDPKLDIDQEEIHIGPLTVGQDHQIEFVVGNVGMRLLFGSIVSNVNWLSFGEGTNSFQKIFQTQSETTIVVTVRGQFLRAGALPVEGKLVVESNGGTKVVTIRADVPLREFPDGVLAGAKTPRRVAELAKAKPKEAAPYFENGSVARWYQGNGWIYPVQGPAAAGLGAVQQYFEALGLARPPRIECQEARVTLHGQPGDRLEHRLRLFTRDKRPVYAHGMSNHSWLRVGTPQLQGVSAFLPLIVDSVPNAPGQELHTQLHVQANGGQQFEIPVTLNVGTRSNPNIPPPLPPSVTAQYGVVSGQQPMQAIPVAAIPAARPITPRAPSDPNSPLVLTAIPDDEDDPPPFAQPTTPTPQQTNKKSGQFALKFKGEFAPGKSFSIVVDISDPLPGQVLRLELPPGLTRLTPQDALTVPPVNGGRNQAQIVWQVRVDGPGRFPIRVLCNSGKTRATTLTIGKTEIDANTLDVDLIGPIELGKVFTVLAKVTKTAPGQQLMLDLPRDLTLMEGPATKPIPPLNAQGVAEVTWRVRIDRGGKTSVRIRSSDGSARTKTVLV